MVKQTWDYLFVVFRIDEWRLRTSSDPSEADTCITIKEVLPTAEEAEREVARLNALAETKECRYFYQRARYYAEGRTSADEAES